MYSLLMKNLIREFLKQRKIEDETDVSDCPGYWDESAKKIYLKIDSDIDNLIQFMDKDCTEEEFLFISEISPELAEMSKSKEYVACMRRLAEKYPKITKKYNLLLDIEDSEAALEDDEYSEKE
ncbi:MAG: hypothetical protein IJ254_04725 [Succinivibrio sp.]|jgi:hypothetical protein|nr:hypothetical protein [Succinivibrio sp.]